MMLVARSASTAVNATAGADFVFVLDISGSIGSKLPTLARGVQQVD
jgi:Mg-chelatase subunit ChlD